MRPTDTPHTGLQLRLDPQLDPAVANVCTQELDSFEAELARWGRFVRPVLVKTTPSRAKLRADAGAQSSALLCALATLDTVTMLAPAQWTVPPNHSALYRALLHELAHVLSFQRMAPPKAERPPVLPVWFREGLAAFVAEGAPPPGMRREVAVHPHLPALARADADVLARYSDDCYTVARLLFSGWLQRFGDRGYAALCRLMRRGQTFEAAHARGCGVRAESFVQAWIDAVKREAATS